MLSGAGGNSFLLLQRLFDLMEQSQKLAAEIKQVIKSRL
jgi:hypothetical protein